MERASPRFPRVPQSSPWSSGWKGKKAPEWALSRRPASGTLPTRSEGNRPGEKGPSRAQHGFGFHCPGTGRGVRGVPGARLPLTLRGARAQTRIHRRCGPHFARNKLPPPRLRVPVERAPGMGGFRLRSRVLPAPLFLGD